MKIIYFYSTVVCVIGFQKLLTFQDILFFNISPSTNSKEFLHPKPVYKISLKSIQAFGHYNNHTLTQMTTKFVFYPPVFKLFKNTDIKSVYEHFRVDQHQLLEQHLEFIFLSQTNQENNELLFFVMKKAVDKCKKVLIILKYREFVSGIGIGKRFKQFSTHLH